MISDELRKFELIIIMERTDEINKLLELDLDDDICDNLIVELEEMEYKLRQSLKAHNRRHLTMVG